MKKYLALMCAAMLCVCCLALAACGGSSSSSAAASGSDSAASASAAEAASSASASSAATEPTFTGDWKFAAMEYQGMTMVGDLSAVVGEDIDIAMTIKDDGTGTMSFQGDSTDLKWTQKDASTITITAEADEDKTLIDCTSKDGALFMTAPIEDMEDATIIFTADGKYAGAKEIDFANAAPIKSADELVGDWTMCGVYMMGVSLYGDPADLATIAGDTDISASFTKDGKASIMGEDTTFVVEADGAYILDGEDKVPVKSLDGNIVVDLSDMLGSDMALVFGK